MAGWRTATPFQCHIGICETCAGTALTAKEKQIHDQGLVTLLQQLHDELDAAVLDAYGWNDLKGSAGVPPASANEESGRDVHALFEEALLTRLVALNHTRAAEEKRGLIRYLRPDYQNPATATSDAHRAPLQENLPGTESISSSSNQKSKINNSQSSINPTSPWPAKLPAQVTLIRQLLTQDPTATAEQLSALFGRKNAKRTEQIEGIIETLKGLGKV